MQDDPILFYCLQFGLYVNECIIIIPYIYNGRRQCGGAFSASGYS